MASMNPFGANWKPAVFGAVTMASLFIVGNPDLISGVIGNTDISKRIFSVAALIAGYVAFSNAKGKNVTGGMIQQTAGGNVVAPGKQGMVDATVLATLASGKKDELTPEQIRLAQS